MQEVSGWKTPFSEEQILDAFGFVYLILNRETGVYYVGKKQVKRRIKRPPLKGKKRNRIDWKESDWRNYWSSSENLQKQILMEGEEKFDRYILALCNSKIDLGYTEVEIQVTLNVLANMKAVNSSIGTNIYRGSMKEDTVRNGLDWVNTVFDIDPDIIQQSPLVQRLQSVLD